MAEWINPAYPKVRMTLDEMLETNSILTSLDEVGNDTSIYDISLLNKITHKERYILTSDGKLYNGAIKCKQTKQKDKVNSKVIRILIMADTNGNDIAFQFIAFFDGDSSFDARGEYARNQLTIVSNRGIK